MVTVQNIFDAAMDLMDEQDEKNGSTKTMDTQEYRLRTISILNMALPALHPYSSSYEATKTGRPCTVLLVAHDRSEPDFEQFIFLDDDLCWGLLPFYLASLLRAGEDEAFSMRMMSEYNKAFADLREKNPAEFEPITTPYGLF